MTRSEVKEQRRKQAKRYDAAVDDPIKAFKLGTAPDGSQTYQLRLWRNVKTSKFWNASPKLMQYTGTFSQLEATYRKCNTSLGVGAVLGGGPLSIVANPVYIYKNKQYLKQLQELAGETSSEDDSGEPTEVDPPSEHKRA